ncbi:MAG: L-rhamnose/proton symporter RhaT [Crocinitomicaceae bacterium]|nr:L-rhamnose/proton symporter RhaT [Crocinitomicaceae bacterium]
MSQVNSRLRFIDVGRSVAIIMMLQGHFISHTLSDYAERKANVHSPESFGDVLFTIWSHMRGLTAPLFFTITGVVFVYLLLGGDKAQGFFKQKRVRKGIKRALSIILIGYILQLNYQNLDYYLSGRINQRFFGFHVLQCIGTGILILLTLYGLFRLSKLKRFSVVLMLAGASVFLATPFISAYGDTYLPRNFHAIFQNVIHGPNSFFPWFPWLGFVLCGGAIGAVLREFKDSIRKPLFPVKFFLTFFGIVLVFVGTIKLIGLYIPPEEIMVGRAISSALRLTEVVLFISILMYAERFWKGRNNAFIKMGQNTLEIYVLHVILLYGAVIGIGLTRWYKHALPFEYALLGAVIFVLIFAVLAKYLDHIRAFIGRIKQLIKSPFVRSK